MTTKLSSISRRNDRIAEWVIKVGGILVIFSVIWILVMISKVSLPLFYPPKADIRGSFTLPEDIKTAEVLAGGVDDSGHRIYLLDRKGTFHFLDTADGQLKESIAVPAAPQGGTKLLAAEHAGKSGLHLYWENGAVTSVSVSFESSRDDTGKTEVSHAVAAEELKFDKKAVTAVQTFARKLENGAVRVDRLSGDRFRIEHRLTEKDLLDNETIRTITGDITDKAPAAVTTAMLDARGRYLYAGTVNGYILRWDISEPGSPKLLDSSQANSGAAITSLAPVLGDYSIAVGDAGGNYNIWFPVTTSGSGEDKRLTLIHHLPRHNGKIAAIAPSHRDKSLVSFSEEGQLRIDHTTTERTLLTVRKSGAKIALTAYSPRSSALLSLGQDGKASVWQLDIPHPEVSFSALFGKIWYEGYNKPEYVWQSSASTDDFEPKLSLVPLIFGTIKATAFAMLFAVPLALLGAIYTSQFMTPTVKNRVKPTVEIMAAIPSVVVGFLAGLWLAPLIDKALIALFIAIIVIPLLILLSTLLWKRVQPYSPLDMLIRGNEFIVFIPIVIAGIYLSWLLGGIVESSVFAGDFKQWLFSILGVRYDQRNCLVIAIALGFAVIPIIFTIAEDALSNVPRNLSAASLALGASRWQTAWRVVLPSALPGVFSAIMIGFGRAIGETMIVLMATGNTPILSWSAFNGLRSLSANIAVEIPEAPLDGSLYRVLFFSAVLLFLLTFVINTAAEALRQRFRKKYGRY